MEDLDSETQARYLDFAVFPEDTPIPELVLRTFWGPKGFDEDKTQDVLDLLVGRSLARRDDEGRLSLHDLQFDYVRKQAENLPDLHNRLLGAYRQKCSDGWHTGPDDGYFFQYLAHHLKEAERKGDLRGLLLDPRWMQAKLEYTDLPALISDYDILSKDADSRLVRDALQLSAHVISHDKTQLASQLLGRLIAQPSTQIQTMLGKIGRCNTGPWIRSLTSTLTPPGGPLLKTLEDHSGEVSAVAVTPDGRRAVSGSSDGTLKVWDLERGEVLRTFEGHSGEVSAVAVTPDGRQVVSASIDQTLKVWDMESGEMLRTFEGHSGGARAVAVTPDGRRAVSGSSDGTLKVWDLERGEVLRTFEGHSGGVNTVAVTPDGRRIVSASSDRTLKVWDLESGEVQKTLVGHFGGVSAVAVTPDDLRAVSASSDRTLKVWDLERAEVLKILEGHSGGVWAVALTPDGRQAVSGSDDRTLNVWDLERGKVQRTLEGHSGEVWAVVVTSDGRHAVSASDDRTLKVWDLETGEIVATFTGESPIYCCAIAPDGVTIVAGDSLGRVHLLRLENA